MCAFSVSAAMISSALQSTGPSSSEAMMMAPSGPQEPNTLVLYFLMYQQFRKNSVHPSEENKVTRQSLGQYLLFFTC